MLRAIGLKVIPRVTFKGLKTAATGGRSSQARWRDERIQALDKLVSDIAVLCTSVQSARAQSSYVPLKKCKVFEATAKDLQSKAVKLGVETVYHPMQFKEPGRDKAHGHSTIEEAKLCKSTRGRSHDRSLICTSALDNIQYCMTRISLSATAAREEVLREGAMGRNHE